MALRAPSSAAATPCQSHARPRHAAAAPAPPAAHRPQRRQRRQHRAAAASTPAVGSAVQHDQRGSGEQVLAVVVVDHGSRKAESNDALLEFVVLYKQLTGRSLVEAAHMELAEPTVAQAVARCAAAGATRVIVAPYFLSRGRHVQQDIPALAAAAAAEHPGLECVVAEPIGIDSLMAQLIENRVAAAEGSATPARAPAAAAPAAAAAAAVAAAAAAVAATAAAAAGSGALM
ncbi:sirohydrochlorin ferrochelatase [Micractinium conductrix]|uniref:Sirohydrochlorin ferrochelatase n=1 Tax=Micractinium conductrix TaxID=554055 RepID=A0A2P6VJ43_9CHLO|nr:sirohydrochlorin ferrochelatase [Micractinium conductrix]|eukprot:PSC74102.1 sirohydrochlorin ferrochelatase [Micractinium conductrix]